VTVGEWLDARVPAPPPALTERIRVLLGADADGATDDVHDVLAAVAERELRILLARGDHSRAIAQDLLAIDALVTYACEAAAEAWEKPGLADTDTLADWCEGFADQLARVGATSIAVKPGGASDVRSIAGEGGVSDLRSDAGLLRREDIGDAPPRSDPVRA
jgi:hypothetical protein